MSLKKVLVVNKSFPATGVELLNKRFEVHVVPHLDYEPESLPAIKKMIKNMDAVVWNTKHKLTKEIVELAGNNLKAITTMSSGTDHIDPAVKALGLKLGNTPKVLDNAVADVAVGLMIAAARRFKEGLLDIHSGDCNFGVNWTLGQDVAGSTVGVVGLGGIGQAVVRRLRGFDVQRFLYYGRTDKPEAKELGATRVNLEELFSDSDFVILACPLTAETKGLVNEATLRLMKNTAIIVNIARGEIIDQNALYQALEQRVIFAAGLDVVTPEPLPADHPLLSLPNCFIIPHMGSATTGTRNYMANMAATNLLCAIDGKEMPFKL